MVGLLEEQSSTRAIDLGHRRPPPAAKYFSVWRRNPRARAVPELREKFSKNRRGVRDFIELIADNPFLINKVRIELSALVVCRAGSLLTPQAGTNPARQGAGRGILGLQCS